MVKRLVISPPPFGYANASLERYGEVLHDQVRNWRSQQFMDVRIEDEELEQCIDLLMSNFYPWSDDSVNAGYREWESLRAKQKITLDDEFAKSLAGILKRLTNAQDFSFASLNEYGFKWSHESLPYGPIDMTSPDRRTLINRFHPQILLGEEPRNYCEWDEMDEFWRKLVASFLKALQDASKKALRVDIGEEFGSPWAPTQDDDRTPPFDSSSLRRLQASAFAPSQWFPIPLPIVTGSASGVTVLESLEEFYGTNPCGKILVEACVGSSVPRLRVPNLRRLWLQHFIVAENIDLASFFNRLPKLETLYLSSITMANDRGSSWPRWKNVMWSLKRLTALRTFECYSLDVHEADNRRRVFWGKHAEPDTTEAQLWIELKEFVVRGGAWTPGLAHAFQETDA